MKKKIIFMLINMNVGGTEKALLNMISEFPEEEYDITILMLEEYGGFLNRIPREVHIEYVTGYKNMKDVLNLPPHIVALNLFKRGEIIKAFIIAFLHVLTKAMKDRGIYFQYVLHGYPEMEHEYDVAVAYAGPNDFISYFVINKIKAKKKIQWIHFDITKIGFNKKFSSKMFNKFDKIFVVSNEARNILIDLIPSLKRKTEIFLNIMSSKLINIESKVGDGFNDNFDGLRILTVGRLTSQKGQDIAIRVLAKLVENGYKVKWYCIGEGVLRNKYEFLVEEYDLKDKFILLGVNPNPYPYIAQCDIYVQPSRHEGYCITLAEARCLKKPIVTTDFAGAKEQIENGETGLIVGIDEDEIYNAVVKLINNKELCNEFSYNLAKENFITTGEMEKIYKFF
jgi:glycosyltransferase involved in cell wall biosynthesis